MINRVILIVIDGLGIGALPDAAEFGDADANTLVHLAEAAGGLNLPTMEALGLGHITAIRGVRVMGQPEGCFGQLGFMTRDVDSLGGYWETNGYISTPVGQTQSDVLSPDAVATIEQASGRKTIGNRIASDAEMLRSCADDHVATGTPIIWTDGRQTCHLAMHESVMPPDALYQLCRDLRKPLAQGGIRRIVARPLVGKNNDIHLSHQRRDFVTEPANTTMLDVLNRAGQILTGVGKVGDLFNGRGLTRTIPQAAWITLFDEVRFMLKNVPRGLIYVGLDVLESDMVGSAAALHDLDRRLPTLLEQLRTGDLFVITGDHGRDARKAHGVPTREYVPVLVTGPKLAQGVNLGIRTTAADLGQTIVEALRGESLAIGESFLDALQPG
ncbi:MAG TPA: phosphopentomutase [Nitrospiraceae bacterium]|jgi:phosphopentomutase